MSKDIISKIYYIFVALYHQKLVSKARVNETQHKFICHQHVYLQAQLTKTAYTTLLRASPTCISRPHRAQGRVGSVTNQHALQCYTTPCRQLQIFYFSKSRTCSMARHSTTMELLLTSTSLQVIWILLTVYKTETNPEVDVK